MPESFTAPRNLASIDLTLPQQPIQNDREEQLSNEQAVVESSIGDSTAPESISNGSGDHLNSEQADVDDSILNSEVYKLYCREKDPEEAMKKIKDLKNCILFEKSTRSFPEEKDFKIACETTLDRLWKFQPNLGDSKFDKIKKFVNEDITLSELENSDDKLIMSTILDDCLTNIRMMLPSGCEYWYVANFDKGPRKSKWYRGESTVNCEDRMLAQLDVMGLKNSTISKLHYDHFITKNSTKKDWFDFAYDFLRYNAAYVMDMEGRCRACFPCIQRCEGEVTATLQLACYDEGERKVQESYHGKSTQVGKKLKSGQYRYNAEMTKEAKMAALKECFRERFGFTEFNDVVSDELNRPITV